MIDWLQLLANALWVFGLSLGLAVVSYASWQAAQRGERLRAALTSRPAQIGLTVSGLFFCAGMAATAAQWWEAALWLGMAAWLLWAAPRR